MKSKLAAAAAQRPALAQDPLSTEDILSGFYLPDRPIGAHADRAALGAKKPKPSHYKIVCISLYTEDIARLDALVAEMKRRGHTKANKSQLIRAALEQIDLDKVPKAH